jgi:hypothetical protein
VDYVGLRLANVRKGRVWRNVISTDSKRNIVLFKGNIQLRLIVQKNSNLDLAKVRVLEGF